MKKVSVLIPVYNCESFIAEAIESALNQTYKNIEVIIVNDGSTDNSLRIARKYESASVKIFSQPNSGAPRARNFALQKSTGYYIQYLDADDILAPNKIEAQVNVLEMTSDKCLTYCSYTRNYDDFVNGIYNDQGINKDYMDPIDLYIDLFHGKGDIITLCWLIPRNLILNSGIWDEELVKGQDLPFFMKIALQAKTIKFCPDTTVFYRITGFNISSNRNAQSLDSIIKSISTITDIVLRKEDSKRVRDAICFLYSRYFCTYYCKQRFPQLKTIENRIKELGGKLTFSGNRYFIALAKMIGVKNTLTIKNFMKGFLS